MGTQKPAVVTVAGLVHIEDPVPTQGDVIAPAFNCRAMKQVAFAQRKSTNDRHAPPVVGVFGSITDGLVRIPVGREHVAVFIGVELHVNADLPQIVQARGAIRLRLGLRQRGEQHGGDDRDDRDDDQQFDECEALPPARRTGCGSVR